jgi:hypothetical protein
MSTRRSLGAFAGLSVVGLAALLVAAGSDERGRAFTLGVPNASQVVKLAPGASACESPIVAPTAFGGVLVWALTPGPPGRLRVTVAQAGSHRPLARSQAVVVANGGPSPAPLSTTVAPHQRLRVCLIDVGVQPMGMLGAGQIVPGVRLTATHGGVAPQAGLAMEMLRPQPRSLLSVLPVAFRRAALFRPGWVGSWTFWMLCGFVLAAFGAVGVALAGARSP